jgi:hypothetical protein
MMMLAAVMTTKFGVLLYLVCGEMLAISRARHTADAGSTEAKSANMLPIMGMQLHVFPK